MEWINDALAIVGGALIRLVIPLAVTFGLFKLLQRLDNRWQKDAVDQRLALVKSGALTGNIGCWDINKCSDEKKASCKAYAHLDTPCWQVYRSQDGKLQESCLKCKVFQKSPVPAIVR